MTGNNFYCRWTSEAELTCFCMYSECDIRPTNGTQCVNVNECLVNNGGCDQTCRDAEGSYSCECNSGYILSQDLMKCDDDNECSRNPCLSSETCVNTYGSYYCIAAGSSNAGLVGAESAAVASASAGSQTVILSTVVAALGSMMLCIILVLGVRQYRNKKSADADRMEKASNVSGARAYQHGTFGFSSKFTAPSEADTVSTAPSADFSTMSY